MTEIKKTKTCYTCNGSARNPAIPAERCLTCRGIGLIPIWMKESDYILTVNDNSGDLPTLLKYPD